MRIVRDLPQQGESAVIAQVSYSDQNGFGVVGDSEITGALVFAPRGIAYRPCAGDHLLLMPVAGADTCLGALTSTAGLAPGELQLSSSGGATIRLCQNGDIKLNGVTITKEGQIIPL